MMMLVNVSYLHAQYLYVQTYRGGAETGMHAGMQPTP